MRKKLTSQKLVILFLLFITIASILSCKENQYRDGKKHGKWTEYLDSAFTKEVSLDSSVYYREVEYDNGYPKGLVKDYFTKSHTPQGEEYLISGPYLQNMERPLDKARGTEIWFDQNNGKILSWSYKDEYGNEDLKKYLTIGFDEISKDTRFDKDFFLSKQTDFKSTIQLFDKFKNNPNLYDVEANKIIADLYAKPNLKELLEGPKGNMWLNFGILLRLQNALKKDQGESDVVDNNNNTSSNNNSSQSQNSSNDYQPSQSQQQRSCIYCNGTGKCKSCMKSFRVHYWKDKYAGWKDENETRPGKIMCDDCHGAGVIYGRHPYGQDPEFKKCYVSSCNGGWKNCPDCNYNGDGQNLGQCKECKGTGFSR